MDTVTHHAGRWRRVADYVMAALRGWVVVTALGGAGLALYALLIEPNRVVVEHATHEMEPRSPARREGELRIAFVSDFDMTTRPGRFERRVRDAVNALTPDLIAIGGDFFGGDDWHVPDEDMPAFREWLSGFHPRLGTVVAWGEQESAWAAKIVPYFPPGPEGVRAIDAACEIVDARGPRVRVCGPEGMFPSLAVDPAAGGRLTAGWGRSPVAARYTAEAAQRWGAVEVTARIVTGVPGDGPGIGVLEAPGRRGYRLRVQPDTLEWGLVSRPGSALSGRTRDPAPVAPRRPYDVRIQVEPGAAATIVRSRIWPAGGPEPAAWGIEFLDTHPERPRAGTVAVVAGGTWTAGTFSGAGRAAWEWIEVRDRAGTLLLHEEFDDPAGVAARWDNPGAAPDAYDATVVVAHSAAFLLDVPHQLPSPPVDLVLAGHSHGGQIRLWPFGPLHLDPEFPRDWSSGFVRIERLRGWLYVTRGVGTSKVPVRLFCPPEVTDFRLILRRRPPQ